MKPSIVSTHYTIVVYNLVIHDLEGNEGERLALYIRKYLGNKVLVTSE